MINLTNPLGKDNPRWPIGNATETIKVPYAGPPAPRGVAIPITGVSDHPPVAVGDAIRTGCGIVAAWLIGLPRRAGRSLFAMNDNEARWHGWQVTETLGGLGRRYRDLGFETLKTDSALRRDEITGGSNRIGPDDDDRPLSGER
jgi:hypothetical protein